MESLKVGPFIHSHFSFDKGAMEFNGKGKFFSIKCAGATGLPLKKKRDLNLFLSTYIGKFT